MRSNNIFSSAFRAFATCPLWLHAAILVGIVISREPGHLLYPEFWAEDGACWYSDAYDHGVACLLMPHTGYLQTISRVGGLVASFFPLVMGPAIFFLIALLAQLAPPVYLLSPLGTPICPSKECRVILSYFYAMLPNSWELHVNLTNAQTHLALLGVSLLMGEAPKSKIGVGCLLATMVLVGLSGPFSLFLTPIALWQWWQKRDRMALANGVAIATTALIQGIFLLQSMHATRSPAPLGASVSGLARILSGEVAMGPLLGILTTLRLMLLPFWKVDWIPCLIASFALIVIAVSIKTGPDSFRKFAVYSAMLLAAALISPQVSMSTPQWEVLAFVMTGTRYFFMPMLTWICALLIMSQNKHRALRYMALILLSLASIGIVNDWTCPRFQHYEEFMKQAHLFDCSPPGTKVSVPINPEGWALSLTKH
jgi:hypothetical protein